MELESNTCTYRFLWLLGGMQYKPCTKKDWRNNTQRPKEVAGCLGSPLVGDVRWNCYHKPHLKAKVCIANGHTTREEKLVETERDEMQWIVQMGIRVLLQSETSAFFKEHRRPGEYFRQWNGLRARITSSGGCLGVWLWHASDRPLLGSSMSPVPGKNLAVPRRRTWLQRWTSELACLGCSPTSR